MVNIVRRADMMSDRDFDELEIRATIAPHSVKWPTQSLHWQRLHAVVDEARARVSRARTEMDEIDRNTDLSREEKQDQRCELAAQALAEFDASKTLVRARQAVRYDGSPDMLKALAEAEAGWERAMDKIAERAAQTKGPDMRRNPSWGVYSRIFPAAKR
jgi:hypothetical protein